MDLKKESITTKLYRWFYATNDLPDNLCPYFWKLVLMYVVLIPYSIISIPAICVEIYDYRKDWMSYQDMAPTLVKPLASILFYGVLMLLGTMLYPLFGDEAELLQIAYVLWAIVFIVLCIIGYNWYEYKQPKPKKEKSPSIVVEFVKAKYNKYCPKIDWK